jgi:hypothetical protein
MLAIGCVLLWSWARVEERQAQLWRVRRQTESLLREQVGRAFDPDPGVSLNGLRMLADHWRRHATLMEPADEDFIEAIAAFVVMYGSGRVVRDGRRSAARWTVPDHKALAARLAVDIALTRSRQPNTIAEWIVGLPTRSPGSANPADRPIAAQARSDGEGRRLTASRPITPSPSRTARGEIGALARIPAG